MQHRAVGSVGRALPAGRAVAALLEAGEDADVKAGQAAGRVSAVGRAARAAAPGRLARATYPPASG